MAARNDKYQTEQEAHSVNEEKNIHNSSAPSINLHNIRGYTHDLSYTPQEERKAVLKADIGILAFLMLLFIFLQFDRTNLANALTGGLREDAKLKTSDINTATTLFTLGFVITELPFNVISKRLGPEVFLPITMFSWGVCTWAQVWIVDRRGLWALRFMIGSLEGGYIPGQC